MARFFPDDSDDEAFECNPDAGQDNDIEFWDETEPWFEGEDGPTCPECHSTHTAVSGAASDGDGDLYNEVVCYDCGASFPEPGSTIWIANDGSKWEREEDMWQRDAELADEEGKQ